VRIIQLAVVLTPRTMHTGCLQQRHGQRYVRQWFTYN